MALEETGESCWHLAWVAAIQGAGGDGWVLAEPQKDIGAPLCGDTWSSSSLASCDAPQGLKEAAGGQEEALMGSCYLEATISDLQPACPMPWRDVCRKTPNHSRIL